MIKYFYRIVKSDTLEILNDSKCRTITNRVTRTQFKKLFNSTPRSRSVWKRGTRRAISGFRCVRPPNTVYS